MLVLALNPGTREAEVNKPKKKKNPRHFCSRLALGLNPFVGSLIHIFLHSFVVHIVIITIKENNVPV